jgi:hypothetical protein
LDCRLWPGADTGVDLKLFVESAYSAEPAKALAVAHVSKVCSVPIDKDVGRARS